MNIPHSISAHTATSLSLTKLRWTFVSVALGLNLGLFNEGLHNPAELGLRFNSPNPDIVFYNVWIWLFAWLFLVDS